MARPLPPLPQPSRRELVIGMSLLIAVGGYGLTRQPDTLRVTPVVSPVVVVGADAEERETRRGSKVIGPGELASIDTLDDTHAHQTH